MPSKIISFSLVMKHKDSVHDQSVQTVLFQAASYNYVASMIANMMMVHSLWEPFVNGHALLI